MTDKKDPGKFTIRFNICDPQHKAVIDLLNRQGRSKAQFLVSAVLHYINCKETPEVSVPVPNQAALEEMILAILAKNQSYLKKQPEPKPSTAQQDAAISAASEPMPPADGAELEQWFGGQDIKSPDDDDDEVVLHILEVIEQREKAIPTGRLSDVDKALEEFQTYYNIPEMNGVTLYPEETAESVTDAVTMVGFIPKRPWIRVLGTIAATVIFMFAMLIGAQAAGIDVFGAIGRWTDETFHFVSFPHSIPQDQETTAPNLENVETCNVIKGALKDCEIPEELAPTWYPVGIEASDPKILSDKLSDTVHIFFSDGDMLFFNLNITRYRSTSYLNTHIFEKDDALVEQYVSGSRTFYIMSNLDAITAVWSDGLFVETISGNLQIDEVKAIVDSIGG